MSKKKITLPKPRKTPEIKAKDIIVLPELQSVLEDASSVISLELAKLKRRSQVGSAPIDLDTARVLQGYVKSAVELSREFREREKLEDPDSLSDKELLEAFLDDMSQEEIHKLLHEKLKEKGAKNEE